MRLDVTWETFLKHPASRNFQVKKLAGCEDVDLAKEYISKDFLIAGTVSQFDAFLILLANKLQMPVDLFTYDKKNVDNSERQPDLPQPFLDGLLERNQLDQKLYDWIDTELFPAYLSSYPGDFSRDLREFRQLQQVAPRPHVKPAVDFIYRNAYLKPVSGVSRILNGLPYSGSYSSD
jgi:hypothetical protein